MEPITTTKELAAVCGRMAKHAFITVDTEFLRETTYFPILCVAQMASTDEAVVVDALADGIDLAPFFKLMANEKVLKVFHAARQDIEIVWHRAKMIPHPVFDTQVAAMVLGYGDSISYDQLVQRITGDALDKSNRFTDWARRPLTPAQLKYATADVTHLRDVYLALSADIAKRGRAEWVDEEMRVLTSPETYRMEPESAWQRLKTRARKPKELAVLMEVAAWREREAQARDVPRNRILKDEAVLEIAAHPPADAEHLSQIRALPNGYANSRAGKALIAAVKEAVESPLPEGMPLPERRRSREPSQAALDLLKTLLRLRATQFRVAARLVAGSDDLERLAAGDDEGVAVLHGWRAEVFGHDAVALRDGKLAISLERGEAVVIETGVERKPRTAKAR
jgi:ribonuclease D